MTLLYKLTAVPFIMAAVLKVFDIMYYVYFDVHIDNILLGILLLFLTVIICSYVAIQHKIYTIQKLLANLQYDIELKTKLRDKINNQLDWFKLTDNNSDTSYRIINTFYEIIKQELKNYESKHN